MKRIEFRLSMPNNNSWNGRWSGEGRNYTRAWNLSDRLVAKFLGNKERDSWCYNFGDGWVASVEARVVPKGERLRRSDGFCGYDWMISSIVDHGEIVPASRRVAGAAPKEGAGTCARCGMALAPGATVKRCGYCDPVPGTPEATP